jgi:hypothetical protein
MSEQAKPDPIKALGEYLKSLPRETPPTSGGFFFGNDGLLYHFYGETMPKEFRKKVKQ